MLEISRLSKRFGSLQALDSLSFAVGDRELVGFVGVNGAGKSTAMRIIMGVLAPDAGAVRWDGVPLDADMRRRIGYMPEERGLYPRMRVGEQLTYLARLHGIEADAARRAGREWTERLGIAERRGEEVLRLSLGNQQRVQLAAALVGSPDLLILDEPFSGLDPVAVDVMSEVLRERAAAGVSTLFSSHQLDVVERLCDRVVIIRSGRLVAAGTIEELRATAEPRWRAVVEVDGSPGAAAGAARAMLAGVLGLRATAEPRAAGTRLELVAGGADEQRLLEAAGRLGRLRELGPVRRPLTEIFREALAAPAESPGAETAAGTAEPTGGPAEAARTAVTGREA
ncbi:ATP-binding cassette domain-containing protein [Actinomyces israelii]|uniref:ATP-binding cassette domain-containing protein n=1 Tax=Actinomyces israelii TaxID=1659 RepID=A0ABT4I9T0_9ACTO|nr:ATP-binding cassette domain-containing protein [Actinomyces israelii]MCZ0857955.1 ATP-binding cassette domain-containing protein [Actinomyces israelii]